MGIVGAFLILRWTISLLRETVSILLDREMDSPLVALVKQKIENDGETKVSDVHLWRVAQNRYACILSVVTGKNNSIMDYKSRLQDLPELAHITIEINPCQ